MSNHDAETLRRVQFTQFVDFGVEDLIIQGWFHCWSHNPYVRAIVEADDGQVHEVEPKRLRFMKTPIPPEYDDIIER